MSREFQILTPFYFIIYFLCTIILWYIFCIFHVLFARLIKNGVVFMEMKRSYQLFLLIMINYSSLVLLRYLSVGHIDKTFFHQLSFDLSRPKALVKLRNIVAETLCFLSMFPCLPTSGNIDAETKLTFASKKAKMFPNKFRNIFCCGTNVF